MKLSVVQGLLRLGPKHRAGNSGIIGLEHAKDRHRQRFPAACNPELQIRSKLVGGKLLNRLAFSDGSASAWGKRWFNLCRILSQKRADAYL